MQDRPTEAAERALDGLPWALLIYLAFVVYGSLLPFEPRPPPTAGAWEAFLRLPYLELGVASRADWVANLLLYIPLGFLIVGSAQGRGGASLIHGLAALVLAGAVAVGVEYAQIFFAPRTVSMNDLLAEWLGAVIGVTLWYVTHRRLGRLLAETAGRGRRALRAAILLYLTVYLVLAVFPFDFLVSADELRWRISTDTWGFLFAAVGDGRWVRRALQLSIDVLATAPLGMLIALDGSSPRRKTLRSAAVAGAAFGLLIELLQFLTASGISQGASVVARGAGAMLGVWFSARAPDWLRRPVPRWVGVAALVALPVYVLVLAALNGWFDGAWLSVEEAVARIRPGIFLPFYYHYFTTELDAVQSTVSNALMYAPVGIGYWLLVAARRSRSIAGVPAALAAALAALVELGKFFAPAKHADPTNVLIAAVSAAFAFAILRRIQDAMFAAQPSARGADVPIGKEGTAVPPLLPPAGLSLPKDAAGWMRLAVGVSLLVAAATILVRFPLWPIWLGAALVVYGSALWRNPSIWLIVVPALLPSLDLATRTGWYYVDELDLFLLVTVGVALLRPAAGTALAPLPRRAAVVLLLFAVAYAIATLRGLLPPGPLDLNAFSNPYSSYEGLRVAKGVIWAFAFLPLVERTFESPERAGRYLATGMTLGLLLAGAWVFHERLVFTGLRDFSTDFRATGAFSGMNTGGNEIEAYLVMALPFAVLALTRRGHWSFNALGLGGFVLGAYALLVTFARGGYAAGAVGLAATALGLLMARRHRHAGQGSWRRLAGAAVTAGIIVLLAIVAVSAPYMAGRFAGTTNDLQTRWSHWRGAVAMMDDGWMPRLFGMGVGRFPETYFWKTEQDDRPGTFAFIQEKGNRFLRLGPGDPLYLRQKVPVQPKSAYRLSLDARSVQPGATFRVFLCEQTLLYSARCEARTFMVGVDGAGWQPFEAAVETGEIGSGSPVQRRPIYLGLSYAAGESVVEIDNVKLVSPEGETLLRNGDFERGFDFWFFAVDWDPAWHIHNLWVAVFFEQGGLGVVAFALLVLSALAAAGRATVRGSRTSAAILGSLAAFLTVGLVGSALDFPRISFLFLLLAFAALVRAGAHAPRRDAARPSRLRRRVDPARAVGSTGG